MKYLLIIFLMVITACGAKKSEPVGAYLATGSIQLSDSVLKNDTGIHVMKIFKDGYWIMAIYGNSFQSMISCAGGTYEANAGECLRRFDYFSRDTSLVGITDKFYYTNFGKKYIETQIKKVTVLNPFIINEAYEKVTASTPLKNTGMEGVWKIKDGQVGYARMGDDYIKIYAYPRFAWVQYNIREKKFIAAGGGTYQYDGNVVKETIDFTTYKIAIGSTIEWKTTKQEGGYLMLYDIDSYFDEEIWRKVK